MSKENKGKNKLLLPEIWNPFLKTFPQRKRFTREVFQIFKDEINISLCSLSQIIKTEETFTSFLILMMATYPKPDKEIMEKEIRDQYLS